MNSLAPPRVLDFAHISPATRLLDKRRQMFEVQEALLSQKEEFARREDALRRREDALRRKDIDLQESLIKFNKFLQENENKKNRALRRIVEERKLLEMKETEKRELEQKESNLLAEKSELDAEVSQHLRYKDYLDLVASTSSKGSTEISEILNRYKTLKEVHRQLMDAQQTAEKSKEDLQREYIVSTKERTNKLLNSNNDISKLKEVLELEHTHTQDVQEENDELTQKYSAKTLELGQVRPTLANPKTLANPNEP